MTMRTTNEVPKDRIYPGGQPDRWIDARQPIPRPGDNCKPPAPVPEPKPCGCLLERMTRAGIPVECARIIIGEFARIAGRVDALEAQHGYEPEGVERRNQAGA